MPPETHGHPPDLDWLAFGYAAGDLDAEASAAFEERLDADQSAREALARAVLLAGSVAVAARADRLGRRRAAALTTLALAACLAFVAAPRLWFVPARDAGTDHEAVALAWSGLRHQQEDAVPAVEPGDDLADRLVAPADAPPHWLLEAANLPDDDHGQGS